MSRHKYPKSNYLTNMAPPIKRWGEMLLEQQMWCWGCDVRRSQGNLLVHYGFKKRSSPEPRFHSAYTYWLDTHCALTIWGWGLWIAAQEHGSLFISRIYSRLRYAIETELTPHVWQERDLPLMAPAPNDVSTIKSLVLMRTAIERIADYEVWLSTQVEVDYREGVLAAWPQRRRYRGGVPVTQMASRWNEFALNLSWEKVGL